MKARIPLPNDLKSAVKTEIAAEWKKIQKEKSLEMAQRCLKVYLYVLNRDYGSDEDAIKAWNRRASNENL